MKKRLLIILTLLACLLIFTTVSFAATGHEDEATKITKDTTTWSGWMIAEGKIEINNNVTISKSSCNLILADGAELTVNGQIANEGYDPDKLLSVYGSDAGTGVLTVNCPSDKTCAFLGNLTVNGGTVNIYAGKGNGNFGIYRANSLIVNGGTLNIKGALGGGDAIASCVVTVNGGAMNILGGDVRDVDEKAGTGTSDTGFTLNGGVVTICGGENYTPGRAMAFDGEDSWNINVKAYGSKDGVTYKKITDGYNKHPFIKFYSAKPATHKTPYIDETGNEKTADAVLVDEGVLLDPMYGWYFIDKDLKLDNSFDLRGATSIIIADGAQLEISGTIKTNGHNLDIYSQKDDSFKIKVLSDSIGAKGDIKIYGGETEIIAGKNSYGLSNCRLNVTGTAKVNVIGGNSDDVKGLLGADNSGINVARNGELTIKGGMGTSEGGDGVSNTTITVTENGVLIISGGDKPSGGSKKGDIFGESIESITAKMFTSDDGVNYTLADPAIKEDPSLANSYNFVKFTDIDHTFVPYIDETGHEQKAKDPTVIDETVTELKGWMVAYDEITIRKNVILGADTNIILADGAKLNFESASIDCAYHKLNIYAQSTGNDAGKLSVKAETPFISPSSPIYISDLFYGVLGDLSVYGGFVDIVGGGNDTSPKAGVYGKVKVVNGNVSITGGPNGGTGIDGNLVVYGGKTVVNAGEIQGASYYKEEENEKGGLGIDAFSVDVYGGELIVNGSGTGNAVLNAKITVKGGLAVLTGGTRYSFSKNGAAFGGNIDEIDARIEISDDGINYDLYLSGIGTSYLYHYPYSLRLTPKTSDHAHNTGDENNIALFIAFAMISSMAAFSVIKYRKKEY